MWVVSGPFDDAESKTKMLKCGQEVPVSRSAGAKLFINNKKISRDQGKFIIGAHSDDDVLDPTTIPTLEFHFSREGVLKRQENESATAKGQTIALHSGDEIWVTKKIYLQVTWVPVVCVTTSNVPVRQCAELGIKLSAKPIEQATHYLVDRITLSPPLFAGLLTPAHIVTEGWLNEHLRLAQLPIGLSDGNADGVNPEQTYIPIPEDRYQPPFDDSLPLDMHSTLQWGPQATRTKLFAKLRFVILTETNRPAGDLVDLITVGGGAYEGFKVQQGNGAFEGLLAKLNAKGKSTVSVVPVADAKGMEAALGNAGWKDFVAAANRQGLKFIGAFEIMQAAYFVDKQRLDCTFIGRSVPSPTSLHEYAPSSMPGESQEVVPPARRPLKRAISHALSVTPAAPSPPNVRQESVLESQTPAPEAIIPARKPLRRRVKTTVESIMGVDDASMSQTPEPSSFRAWSAVPVPMPEVPATPLRNPKLKRRTATQQQEGPEKNPYDISIGSPIEEEEEPPLKKFKKMFEDSDPDRLVNSQTQGPELRTLSSIVEQAYEERTEAMQNALRGMSLKKRKRTADDVGTANEDEEATPHTRASSRAPSVRPPLSKRRALTQVQSTGGLSTVPEVSESQVAPSSSRGTQPQKSQPSASTSRAKPTEKKKKTAQPDRDEDFLKALASTKKGKKKEDQYDRDFNELRVARPTQAHLKAAVGVEDDLEAWNAIEKDMDIHGNFMVVMEDIEPRAPREPEEVGMRREGRPEWVGRPDFKKFKSKNEQSRQETHRNQAVALVANKIVANGLDLLEDPHQTCDLDDGFEDDHPVKGKGKGRATSRQPASAIQKRGAQSRVAASFEDEDDMPNDDNPPPRSRPIRYVKSSRSQPEPLFVSDSDDDDLMDGGTLKGSDEDMGPTRGAAGGAKRKAVVLADNDSDDNLGFRGPSKKKARR